MAKKKVVLTHVSYKQGAEGVPGDELTIDAELAERWHKQGGCKILEEDEESAKPAAKQPAKPAAKDEK